MAHWHHKDIQQVLEELNTSKKGLSKQEAAERLGKYGPNLLQAKKARSRVAMFFAQFADLMIIILAVAAVISFFIGDAADAVIILLILIANAIIGFVQEYNAEQSIQKLQRMAAQDAVVERNGSVSTIKAAEIVPGDIIHLEAGNVVPADARIIKSSGLKTEEAALTGESHGIAKHANLINQPELPLADQLNMAFKSTIVSNGSAVAVVTATGMQSEMGKIAGMLDTETGKTPLQKRLSKFSKQLAVIVFVICLIVFLTGWWRGEPLQDMFFISLSLIVAALPEALPAVITIALAKGATRMVQQKALVRKLPAVETLGSVTYICSDKTGTLTQNKMTVSKLEAAGDKEEELLKAMLLNHELKFDEQDQMLGDSTEIALFHYASLKKDAESVKNEMPELAKIPFDSDRMRMSTLHDYGDKKMLLVKGAPKRIADVLNVAEDKKRQLLDLNREWAAEGLRVLFYAYKLFDHAPEKLDISHETALDYLGMVGMIDPPREEVVQAIEECKQAGIHTVMITGDQPHTARAIALELKMIEREREECILAGAEMNKLSPEELAEKARSVRVYARVSPEQKLNIVKALQANGEYVAMTGDGVNDAPSLKQADIGVAMGITGTDVSKEAAAMILLDDNFATIVKAVKEGRRIYQNIKKFVHYVMASNLGEILTIFLSPFFGFPIPLLPIHLLWLNLITDGLPGLALTQEPADAGIMKQKPRSPNENIFTETMAAHIFATGIVLVTATLSLQWWGYGAGIGERNMQTIIFTFLALVQLCNALSVRTRKAVFAANPAKNRFLLWTVIISAAVQVGMLYVPFVQQWFKLSPISSGQWMAIFTAVLASIIVLDSSKLLINKYIKEGRH